MSSKLPLLTTLAVGVALAASAPTAGATTFCVQDPSCAGSTVGTIQAGLSRAASEPGADTVQVGARSLPYTGPFTYNSNDPLVLAGRGDGTVLAPSASVVTLAARGDDVTVRDLLVRVPSAEGAVGISLRGTAERVTVTGDATSPTTGILPIGEARVSESTIDVPFGTGLGDNGQGRLTVVSDSVIKADTGVSGSALVERTRIAATGAGLSVGGPGSTLRLRNSVVRIAPEGDGRVVAVRAFGGADVRIDHSTLVGVGGPLTGILAFSREDDGTVAVADSVITGFTNGLNAAAEDGAVVRARFTHSLLGGAIEREGATSVELGAGTLGDVDPRLDADGRPATGSPLVDAGDPGGDVAEDIAGAARPQDGDGDGLARRDIGAFELPAVAAPPAAEPVEQTPVGPAADPAPPPPVATPRLLRAVRLVPKVVRRGRAATLGLSLTAASDVRVVAQRRRGRRLSRPRRLFAAVLPAGDQVVRLKGVRSLRPGRYRITVALVPGGGPMPEAVLSLRVRRPR